MTKATAPTLLEFFEECHRRAVQRKRVALWVRTSDAGSDVHVITEEVTPNLEPEGSGWVRLSRRGDVKEILAAVVAALARGGDRKSEPKRARSAKEATMSKPATRGIAVNGPDYAASNRYFLERDLIPTRSVRTVSGGLPSLGKR